MLVSVALFATVMVMALGALLALSVADRRAEATKSAMDNMTFALDSMSRAIRTGSSYQCNTGIHVGQADCAAGGTQISFTAATGGTVYYRLDKTTATCGQTGTIGCIERSFDNATWSPITSPDIVITNSALFTVLGQSATVQPTVLITATGIVQLTATQQTPFYMQTTVTQRIYDL